MFINNGALKKGEAPDKIISLLYTTGYRLTGNHQSAEVLVNKALRRFDKKEWGHTSRGGTSSIGGRLETAEVVKYLCIAFVEDSAIGPQQQPKPGGGGTNGSTRGNKLVQEAILNLEPEERTVVVLRDTLGFSYAEIAKVTLTNEKDVAGKIASARWTLRKLLAPAAV